MQIKYFEDTDTLYIVLTDKNIVETKDLDQNILLEFDENQNVVAFTIEHASKTAQISEFSFQQIKPVIELRRTG